jgi:hypothetical protein
MAPGVEADEVHRRETPCGKSLAKLCFAERAFRVVAFEDEVFHGEHT